jgi:acetamidase/formamidase
MTTPQLQAGDRTVRVGLIGQAYAAEQALPAMIDALDARRCLDRAAAYRPCSLAAELTVTQPVNAIQGIRERVPKGPLLR